MDGLTLLERAEAAGLQVFERFGKLVVRGPRSQNPLAQELFAAKQDVLAALQERLTRERLSGSPFPSTGLSEGDFSVFETDSFTVGEFVPFFTSRSVRPCWCCGGTKLWRLKTSGERGDYVCGRCHPPAQPKDQIEWLLVQEARAYPERAGGERDADEIADQGQGAN